uniref:Uncharacterized protein n=1 Tax=Meloidogyne javanica TaxID=6303 RepID=A0A915LQM1_MELJA
MTASANTELPSDSELVVPQELTLSTPWLKAVVVYMGAKCEKEMNVEVTDYAKCLDDCRGGEMLIPYCRRLQYPLDICVEEKMGIKRPMVGYFSKLHRYRPYYNTFTEND